MRATKTVCMCECECPIRVLDLDLITCDSCNEGDHWDPKYEMNWAKSFAVVALILMVLVLFVWAAGGGVVARP